MKKLQEKIQEYSNSLENILTNRQTWKSTTKPLLIETLNKIKNEFKIGWSVQDLDLTENLEGVNLTFGKIPSGLKEHDNNSYKQYYKKGGTIVFSQSYNGEVFVIIMYPSVENFVPESDIKLLGIHKLEFITEEFIIDKVYTFIDEMIKWEKTSQKNPVGYKLD